MALPSASTPSFEPLLGAVAGVIVIGVALLLLHGRTTHRRLRWTALITAALLLGAIWFSPLNTVAQHYLLSAHLLQVTLLMGAIPPLLLLALPRDPRVRMPRWLQRTLRVFVHPLVAIFAVNAAFFGWHTVAPYQAAMQNDNLWSLEQVSLLLTSVMFWWPIVTPFSPPVKAMSPLGKIGYIVLATIPQTFGGLVVALAHHPLYSLYADAPRLLGLDPLTDQQIAGASIALVSKIALFTAFTVIFVRMLNASASDSEDGGGGGGGGPQVDRPRPRPSGTPRWLEDIQAGRTVPEPALPRRVKDPAGSGPRPG
ncbi:MAG: cytochrome c oxidase assembly protein [Candidatus Dormibacteraeota bacterium]|nr:cytochrome c oxidase assembly protein [Candidatus Dormibacteraeota bacterium]